MNDDEELVERARFVCIADVHIGNHGVLGGTMASGLNERCDLIIRAMAALANRFNENPRAARSPQPRLAIAGDLFDVDKPSPAILARTMGVVEYLCNAFSGGVVIIPGNHDRTSETESALLPLHFITHDHAGNRGPRIACEDITLDDTTIYLSFQSRMSPLEHVRKALAIYPNDNHVERLVLHYGIMDDTTPPWLHNAADAIHVDDLIAELQKFPHPLNVFAGNWHDQRSWPYIHETTKRGVARGVYQCGAFVSTGFDNEGSKTGRAWCELDDGSVASLQCNVITFETLHDISELPPLLTAIERDPWAKEEAYRKFFRVLLDPDKAAEQRAAVTAMVGLYDRDGRNEVARNVRIDFRLRAPNGTTQEEAELVARSCVSGVGEALSAYVDQMPLPDGVDRALVLAEARRLVKLEDA